MHTYNQVCLGVVTPYNMIFGKNSRTRQLTFVLLGNIYFFRFFLLILPSFRLFSSYVGGGSPPKFFLMKSGKYGFSSLIMPKLFQLILFKNIIFFYVNQSNHLLTLTYLGGCFTPLNRLLADKKKYESLSFWSPTTYV